MAQGIIEHPSGLIARVWDVKTESIDLNGITVPRDFRVMLDHPDWPVRVDLLITVDPERGPIPMGIATWRFTKAAAEMTDVPTYRELDEMVTARVELRGLVAQMTAEAAGVWHRQRIEQQLLDSGQTDDWDRDKYFEESARLHDEARLVTERAAGLTAPRRRRSVTARHLEEVARIYRSAVEDDLPPTQAVQRHFDTSHSTAAKWVARARQTGALGPARRTAGGEGENHDG